jgi:hypothetical protein
MKNQNHLLINIKSVTLLVSLAMIVDNSDYFVAGLSAGFAAPAGGSSVPR